MLVSSKLEIKDYISMLHALLDLLTFDGITRTNVAMLASLYCREFVKNCNNECF